MNLPSFLKKSYQYLSRVACCHCIIHTVIFATNGLLLRNLSCPYQDSTYLSSLLWLTPINTLEKLGQCLPPKTIIITTLRMSNS